MKHNMSIETVGEILNLIGHPDDPDNIPIRVEAALTGKQYPISAVIWSNDGKFIIEFDPGDER